MKLGFKIHEVGLPNQDKSVLGGLWRDLGTILAPRPAQDQNIPTKPVSGGPSWASLLEAKVLPRAMKIALGSLLETYRT